MKGSQQEEIRWRLNPVRHKERIRRRFTCFFFRAQRPIDRIAFNAARGVKFRRILRSILPLFSPFFRSPCNLGPVPLGITSMRAYI